MGDVREPPGNDAHFAHPLIGNGPRRPSLTPALGLDKAGVPLATVQRILRRSDPAITNEVYSHIPLDGMRQSLNQFARMTEVPEQSPAMAARNEPSPLAAGLLLEETAEKQKPWSFNGDP
ncbi:hypothetical protein [Archangium violaceum]|uniref:hypothetical protein n=1 Tax=Archangium violaceum TaxID=83451 RepID=UPI0036DE2EE0